MAEGGFLIKFDGKEVTHCFAVAFDYDLQEYTVNNTEKKQLHGDVEIISIVVERS